MQVMLLASVKFSPILYSKDVVSLAGCSWLLQIVKCEVDVLKIVGGWIQGVTFLPKHTAYTVYWMYSLLALVTLLGFFSFYFLSWCYGDLIFEFYV